MNDWKKLCVGPEATLGEAIRQIDRWAQQVAMVVDGEDRLLGIVTDGDARRALLRGLGMDAPVSEVMGATPRTAKVGASREAQVAEMQRASIRHAGSIGKYSIPANCRRRIAAPSHTRSAFCAPRSSA